MLVTKSFEEFGSSEVPLRSCLTPAFWCCNRVDPTADCCSEGKGIVWNNASLVNYALEPQQTDYTFELAGEYKTVLAAAAASSVEPRTPTSPGSLPAATLSTATTPFSSTASSTATNDPVPTPTYTCPPTPGFTLVAGLGAGLGVPLLAVSAALLWMLAK